MPLMSIDAPWAGTTHTPPPPSSSVPRPEPATQSSSFASRR